MGGLALTSRKTLFEGNPVVIRIEFKERRTPVALEQDHQMLMDARLGTRRNTRIGAHTSLLNQHGDVRLQQRIRVAHIIHRPKALI